MVTNREPRRFEKNPKTTRLISFPKKTFVFSDLGIRKCLPKFAALRRVFTPENTQKTLFLTYFPLLTPSLLRGRCRPSVRRSECFVERILGVRSGSR